MSRNVTKVIGATLIAAVAISAIATGHIEILSGLGLLAFFLLLI
jgi:hypothetical protein